MQLNPHPRLYLDRQCRQRLRREAVLPLLAAADQRLAAEAAVWRDVPPLDYPRDVHNAHLIRARLLQTRVVTLLARWLQTDDAAYRDAALAYTLQMTDWDEWSWIAWRAGQREPDAIFDLSYGENSATLAIAYDLLHGTLTELEEAKLVATARTWPLRAARKHLLSEEAWWYRHAYSNWNTVCAGGLGMLLLAMWERLDEPAELLEKVETSFEPYFATLGEYDGAWPEGIGYWNYGMRYAFMYLLSWERATGRSHPLMRQPGVRQTLEFPLLLCPHGQPCSFSDVNRWTPLPFHYAVARRLGHRVVCQSLEGAAELGEQSWPNAAEWRLLHPGAAR